MCARAEEARLPSGGQYANSFDQTALYLCAARRTGKVISYLMERGASVTKGSDTFSRSVLFEYFEKCMDPDRLGILIDQGASFNGHETSKVAVRPLPLAPPDQDDSGLPGPEAKCCATESHAKT